MYLIYWKRTHIMQNFIRLFEPALELVWKDYTKGPASEIMANSGFPTCYTLRYDPCWHIYLDWISTDTVAIEQYLVDKKQNLLDNIEKLTSNANYEQKQGIRHVQTVWVSASTMPNLYKVQYQAPGRERKVSQTLSVSLVVSFLFRSFTAV